jgi:hypothetical protein
MARPSPILPLLLAVALAAAGGASAAVVKSNIMLASIPGGRKPSLILAVLFCSDPAPGNTSWGSRAPTSLRALAASTRPRAHPFRTRSPRPPLPRCAPIPAGWAGLDFIQTALTAARVPYTLVQFSAGSPNVTALLAPDADGALPFSGFIFYPNVEVVGSMLGADLVQVRFAALSARVLAAARPATCCVRGSADPSFLQEGIGSGSDALWESCQIELTPSPRVQARSAPPSLVLAPPQLSVYRAATGARTAIFGAYPPNYGLNVDAAGVSARRGHGGLDAQPACGSGGLTRSLTRSLRA